MTETFCEHGYRHGKRCPMCDQPDNNDEKPAKRRSRSVYEEREFSDGGVGRDDWWREL
jgi:hypothetical protein